MRERGIPCDVLNCHAHEREAEIISQAGQPGRVTIATNMAGRGTDIKVHPDVLARGGLHVVATEMYSSRRIDLQLIGRTGAAGENPARVSSISRSKTSCWPRSMKVACCRFAVALNGLPTHPASSREAGCPSSGKSNLRLKRGIAVNAASYCTTSAAAAKPATRQASIPGWM